MNGGTCLIKVYYTYQWGEAKEKLLSLPDNYSTDELKAFAKAYNEDILIVHHAIEALRLDSESKMPKTYPMASVD